VPAGWTIRVTTQRLRGVSMQKLYHAAIDGERQAKDAVRKASGGNGAIAETVGQLTSDEIGHLGLRPGDIRPVPKATPTSQ
jgi:hypothetical protein